MIRIIFHDPFQRSRPQRHSAILLFLVVFFLTSLLPADTSAREAIAEELFDMDLRQLMEMEVVTATRSKVKIKDSPSAIYVITDSRSGNGGTGP